MIRRIGREDARRIMALRTQHTAPRHRKLGIPRKNRASIIYIHDGGANKAAGELGEEFAGELAPLGGGGADDGEGDRDGGVDGGGWVGEEPREGDTDGPGEVDREPGAVGVGGEEDLGDDAFAEDDEEGSAEEFGEVRLEFLAREREEFGSHGGGCVLVLREGIWGGY